MVSESRTLSGGSEASAAKEALLLSFRAFDLAIAAAAQSGLPFDEWFRCALVHVAGKGQGTGEHEVSVAHSPSDTLSGERAPHPEQNMISDDDPSKDLLKQAGGTLIAQDRINELCDALQGLINLSDSKRITDLAEVKRSLAHAKEVLLASRQIERWREPSTQNCEQQNQRNEAA
jgi:hypothetical protein